VCGLVPTLCGGADWIAPVSDYPQRVGNGPRFYRQLWFTSNALPIPQTMAILVTFGFDHCRGVPGHGTRGTDFPGELGLLGLRVLGGR